MIAKLIVWGKDRSAALRLMRRALEQVEVVGVSTNVAFLSAVVSQTDFAAGQFNTGFIALHHDELIPAPLTATDQVLALVCLSLLLQREVDARQTARNSNDPWSPWHSTSAWRANGDNHHLLHFVDGETDLLLTLHYRDSGYLLELPSGPCEISGRFDSDGSLLATVAGQQLQARVVRRGMEFTVLCCGRRHSLVLHDPQAEALEQEDAGGRLTAPMPGKIIALLVAAGSRVTRGTPLLIMEAMKMEHTINAPGDGLVTQFNYQVGALVNDGAPLLAFEADEGS
jgi:3-methylcrotonyl-CoA carboxylase alpha subunit